MEKCDIKVDDVAREIIARYNDPVLRDTKAAVAAAIEYRDYVEENAQIIAGAYLSLKNEYSKAIEKLQRIESERKITGENHMLSEADYERMRDSEQILWAMNADVAIDGISLQWCGYRNAYRITTLMINEPEEFRKAHDGNVRYRWLERDGKRPILTEEARRLIKAAMAAGDACRTAGKNGPGNGADA